MPVGTAAAEPAGGKCDAKVVGKSGKKICCACPTTKTARDQCCVERGTEDARCIELINAHKACLREDGFDV